MPDPPSPVGAGPDERLLLCRSCMRATTTGLCGCPNADPVGVVPAPTGPESMGLATDEERDDAIHQTEASGPAPTGPDEGLEPIGGVPGIADPDRPVSAPSEASGPALDREEQVKRVAHVLWRMGMPATWHSERAVAERIVDSLSSPEGSDDG